MQLPRLVLASLALLATLSFSGCASVNRQAANVFPDPKPDKGLVYFYRESRFVGMAISYNVREKGSDQVIGAIANGTYFFHFVEPGTHTFVASTEADTEQVVQVEAGKTYYIDCGLKMGVLAGRPNLRLANDFEAKPILPSLQYATK